jgi:hypothetical protein
VAAAVRVQILEAIGEAAADIGVGKFFASFLKAQGKRCISRA